MTIAHAGHWLAQLAYVAPLAVLAAVVLVGRLRERLARRRARQLRGSRADVG